MDNIVIDRTAAQLTNAIDITDGASATGENATALGNQSKARSSSSIAIGVLAETKDTGDIAIGGNSKAEKGGQAVGSGAEASGNMALAIGQFSKATGQNSIAHGNLANATARNAIQIGEGTNGVENTAKIHNTTILDATGKIPFSALQGGEVVGLAVNSNNHLIVTYASGSTADLGKIGGGGTKDYTQLENKPSVNGKTLIGNKTSADLSLQDRTIVQGTDSKNYYVQFGMQSGKPALILTEVQTNE